MSLHDEIVEQPAAAERQLASSRSSLEALATRLRERPVAAVVLAARGTSDHAAIYAQYALGVRNGLSVGLATPSVVSLYGANPDVRASLVVGISQSGASPDIVGVVESAARQGAPTLAITNDPASPLGAAADHVIDLAAGPELAVAATKTYTTSLLAIARLSAALAAEPSTPAGDGASPGLPDLEGIPAAIATALETEPAVESIARELAGMDRCVVVGRGFEYATAREWALKLKELAQVFADPYSAADFLHGPIALLHPGIPALVLAPLGAAHAGQVDLLRDLRTRAIDSVVVSDDPATLELGRWSIPIPAAVPEWLRPIVSIVPAQLFAYHLTLARGLDAEAPRSLSKVTRTL